MRAMKRFTDEELRAELEQFAQLRRINILTARIRPASWIDVQRLRVTKRISADDMAAYFGISRASLYRKEEEGGRLTPAESAALGFLRRVIQQEEEGSRASLDPASSREREPVHIH